MLLHYIALRLIEIQSTSSIIFTQQNGNDTTQKLQRRWCLLSTSTSKKLKAKQLQPNQAPKSIGCRDVRNCPDSLNVHSSIEEAFPTEYQLHELRLIIKKERESTSYIKMIVIKKCEGEKPHTFRFYFQICFENQVLQGGLFFVLHGFY